MAITEAFIDELKTRIRVADVVGRRVKLVRKGREFMGLCPFHSEKSPSFSVNEQKGFYHCFGCGAHGDAIKFVCETEGLGFREAVERLASEAGMEVPVDTPMQREREEQRRSLYDVVTAAQAFYRERLSGPGGANARAYLAKRELDAATVEAFGLGFAPEGSTTLIQHLTAKNIPLSEIIEAGLAVIPEGRSEAIDFFRNRLTIPIADNRGRVIAFGARTLLPDGKPKYINTGETPLFHKGRTLYNLDRARKPAFDAQSIIVAEGYLDVIALAKAGITNAVAPLGTALTEDQIALLWKIAPEPVLCFDGDSAGKRAAHRALDRAMPLLKPGQSLRFAFLPEGLDPDDLVKRDGAAAMQKIIAEARPMIEVFWERERDAADLSTPERRAALERRIGDLSGAIEDPIVRDHYRRELKDRLWGLLRPARTVRPGAQYVPLRQLGGQPAKPSLRRPPPPKSRFGQPPQPVYGQNPASLRNSAAVRGGSGGRAAQLEHELCWLLCRFPGPLLQDYEAVELLSLENPRLEGLKIEILHYAVEHEVLDESDLRAHLSAQGHAETLSGLEKTATFGLDRTSTAELSPDEVLMRWREAATAHRTFMALRPAVRRARGEWARDQSEGARRSLEEAEAAFQSGLNALSGEADTEL
jgi:DNA primase